MLTYLLILLVLVVIVFLVLFCGDRLENFGRRRCSIARAGDCASCNERHPGRREATIICGSRGPDGSVRIAS